MNTTSATDSAQDLRNQLVDQLVKDGTLHSPDVESAMRTVPRHLFVPAVSLADAYADQAVNIKENPAGGLPLSCASVPTIVAIMLEQLDVRSGDNVLEIGAGTGYNAALLRALGATVTTVDIDEDVTTHARQTLDTTGNGEVEVITADGALGHPANAPYDQIIVTVGAWDIPTAWGDQLREGGRLVVPLRWRGTTRSVAFTKVGGRLLAFNLQLCGFVPMLGQEGELQAPITDDGSVLLHWDIDQPIDPARIHGVLNQPRRAAWSGTTVGSTEPFDGVWLRMTATEPGTCRIEALPAAVESGLCKPAIPTRSPALVEGVSLAYFVFRRLKPTDGGSARAELGAVGHGAAGAELAARLCAQIRDWGNNRDAMPALVAVPAGTPAPHPADGYAIDKRESRLFIHYK